MKEKILKLLVCVLLIIGSAKLYPFIMRSMESLFIENKKIPSISLSKINDNFLYQYNYKNIANKPAEVIVLADDGRCLPFEDLTIVAAIVKYSKNIFEFGTAIGRTTYIMAKNSSPDTRIKTLSLKDQCLYEGFGNNKCVEKGLNQQTFYYDKTDVSYKINQIYGDSTNFDETTHLGKYDFIFIDGSHEYSVVKSDTEKALKMLAPKGIIIWDDYNTRDIRRYLNELGEELKLYQFAESQKLVFYKRD